MCSLTSRSAVQYNLFCGLFCEVYSLHVQKSIFLCTVDEILILLPVLLISFIFLTDPPDLNCILPQFFMQIHLLTVVNSTFFSLFHVSILNTLTKLILQCCLLSSFCVLLPSGTIFIKIIISNDVKLHPGDHVNSFL